MKAIPYKHYKGKIYYAFALPKNTETGEELVVYTDDERKDCWARPSDMFFGKVEVDGKLVRRFEPVEGEKVL